VVDASCHGVFEARDFLRSRLVLAMGEELTLADLLSYQTDLRGLRLLVLSACQTALLDLQGARDEVYSLAAGMLQAGADAVLASLWSVDDKATYLLMMRLAQEWFPQMTRESPAAALARASLAAHGDEPRITGVAGHASTAFGVPEWYDLPRERWYHLWCGRPARGAR
jgi:CHAT domain-containing protein